MKKIILIILTIILILSVNVLAVDIDIGSPAIDRGSVRQPLYTYVNEDNPANEDGTITQVEIYAVDGQDLVNCEVAIFFVVSGDNLSTRDTEYIGAVVGGAKRTFAVDLDVKAGDFIGIYFTAGQIESIGSGFVGVWSKYGDQIPCTDVGFSSFGDDAISLYGTGTTAVGWSHKWNTQTISKWNTKEFTKWNGLE